MIENHYWSSSIGRWLGVPIRIHVTLVLFSILIFGVAAQHPNAGPLLGGTAFATTLVLLASLLAHELGHTFALTNLGGHVNGITFTPWGGNSDLVLPPQNNSKILVYLAGPFTNLAIFLFAATLLIQSSRGSLTSLINPFDPHSFRPESWEVSLLTITAWVNFQLFAVNLVPCFPFDGAQVLRYVIEILNPSISKLQTEASIRVFGQAVAIALLGAAWFLRGYSTGPIQPAWCFLALFAVTTIFCTRYSYLQQTTHLEDPWDELNELEQVSLFDENSFFDYELENMASYSKWLSEKQEARRQDEIQIESDELEEADIILEKLHEQGIDSLTEEERSLLARVSQRLRAQRDQEQMKSNYGP